MQNLNNTLVQTGEIVSELECLFQNSQTICLKQNASGWGTNERIIFAKNKKLYYAKIFEGYDQRVMRQIPQESIKAFVNLDDIYQINYLPKQRQQKKTLCIVIPQERINQQSSGNPSTSRTIPIMTSRDVDYTDRKMKFVKWIFHFQFDLKQKLNELRQLQKQRLRKQHQLSIDEELLRIMNQNKQKQNQNGENEEGEDQEGEDDDEEQDDEDPNNNSLNSQGKKKKKGKKKNKLEKGKGKKQARKPMQQEEQMSLSEYVNQIRKAKDYLKMKQNRQKQQIQERRKKKPHESVFQQANNTFNENNNNDEEQVYTIANHWRSYFSALQDRQLMRNKDRNVYEYQLMVYKQIHNFKETCLNIFKNYIFEKMNGKNGEKWKFQQFFYYKGIWIKLGGKQLNQEFLMYYYISDLTNITNKNTKIPYRVPDIVLIDYLGFKALCMCDLPFSEIQKSQVYNLFKDGFDLQNISRIKQQLSIMQRALNLKNEDMQRQLKKIAAPLGTDVRIFEYNPKKDLKIDQSPLQTFYYFTNFQSILPLDFNYQFQDQLNLEYRLRPQLIGDMRDQLQRDYEGNTQLLTTAFMVSPMSQEQKTLEDDKIVVSSKSIYRSKIPELVEKLNNVELIIIDSFSLKMYMSDFGINMRYMYRIHQLAKIKYLREIIEAQCIARTVKRIFRKALRDLGANHHQEKKKNKEFEALKNLIEMDAQKNQNNTDHAMQKKFKSDSNIFDDYSIDFLNLVFGKGEESAEFWKILVNETLLNFKVKVNYPYENSPGALLHAVLYNCSIDAIFDMNVPLFKTESPFSKNNHITLKAKIKVLQYPSFEIQKLIRGIPSIESIDHPNIEVLESIALKLYKMDLLKNYYLNDSDFVYHLSFSKVNAVKKDMKKPTHASSHHPSEISYYITNKTQANFQKAMNLLSFCFSDYHPIYVSFYEEYSHFYQPQLLKKTAILQAIKCFGEFHPKTAELYATVYKNGYKEFYNKSLRSESVLCSRSNIKDQFESGKYYSCMMYCFKQIELSKVNESRVKKENCIEYLEMLIMGMKSAQRIRYFNQSLTISSAVSDLLNKFKLKDYNYHYELILEILKIKMTLAPEKMFLYKLALLCISVQEKYNQRLKRDKYGMVLPAVGKEKQNLSMGIMNEYFSHETHTLWLQNIFKNLLESLRYFNHLEDLFTNFQYHLKRYENVFFKQCLGYWDILIRLYGQKIFKDYLYQTGNI